jgi:hypothetical protein
MRAPLSVRPLRTEEGHPQTIPLLRLSLCCLPACLPVCLSVYVCGWAPLSVCLSVCLSVGGCVCVCVEGQRSHWPAVRPRRGPRHSPSLPAACLPLSAWYTLCCRCRSVGLCLCLSGQIRTVGWEIGCCCSGFPLSGDVPSRLCCLSFLSGCQLHALPAGLPT